MRAPLSCFLIAATVGCHGLIGDTLTESERGGFGSRAFETPTAADSPPFACAGSGALSRAPLRRLTRGQLENTLRDLFGEAGLALVGVQLSALPSDRLVRDVNEFVNFYSELHLETLTSVAIRLGTFVVETPSERSRIFSACATPTVSCLAPFFDGFAARIYRRPLRDSEEAGLSQIFADSVSPTEGLANVLAAMLMAPAFLYRIETGGTETEAGERFTLTPHELAARLSYLLWDTMPDAELFGLARDGRLSDPEVVRGQVLRMLDAPAGRTKLMSFFRYWLTLDATPQLGVSAAFSDGVPVAGLREEMLREIEEFIAHVLWEEGGDYEALMTARRSFAKTAALASIHEHPLAYPSEQTLGGSRMGVLLRAPVLLSGTDQTSPIRRGVFVLRRVLCDPLPNPDLDAISRESATITEEDLAALSTRDQVELRTADVTCQQCHARINPAGFSLESFDALGREIDEEVRYSESGLPETFPIDDDVSIPLSSGGAFDVQDAHGLAAQLAHSTVGPACFVRQAVRFYRVQMESTADTCVMQGAYDRLKDPDTGSLVEAIAAVVFNEQLYSRRVSP